MNSESSQPGTEAEPMPHDAAAPANTTPAAPPPGDTRAAGSTPSRRARLYGWIAGGISVAMVLVFLIVNAARIVDLFTLPECNADSTLTAVKNVFAERKVAFTRLGDVNAVSATRSERTCTARAEIPGGILSIEYRITWSGWEKHVSISRADAEARIEDAELEAVTSAANQFMTLAKDSAVNGRPPRQAEPRVAGLLDKIFDVSAIAGAPLVMSDVGKASAWFAAGDRVGTVYILAGTGVTDIEKLPNTLEVQRRTHENVGAFAPEFARYLDFQIKLAGIMMEAELNRTAKAADTLDQADVKQEIADVRSTLADSLTGALTTLAYEGPSDDWRRARLAVMMQVAPKAATFLAPEQARAVRNHALTVASFVREPSVQDQVNKLAEVFAGK